MESKTSSQQCPRLQNEYMPFAGPHLLDPYSYHAELRKDAPVAFHSTLGMWVVARYDNIVEVLRNPAHYSSGKMIEGGTEFTPEALSILAEGYPMGRDVLSRDPPEHGPLRRQLNRAFTPSRIALQEPRIRAIANEIVDTFIRDGKIDIIEKFTYPLPLQIILEMVGASRENMAQVKRWGDDLVTLFYSRVPPESQPELCRSLVAYQRYVVDIIERYRKEPGENLTSYIVNDPESEATLADLILTILGSFIAAGHETTADLFANCLHILLSKPQYWEALKEDRSRIPKMVEEVMRYECPIHAMMRVTTEDVVLGGVAIPKDARLLLLYMSANRDETQFPDADQFNPDREKQNHLGFGLGTHYCLGAPLARLEIQIGLEVLLERIPEMRLVPNQSIEPKQNLMLRGVKQLWVEWPVRDT